MTFQEELFKTASPPRTNYNRPQRVAPRQSAAHYTHRASRAPNLPTIASGKKLRPESRFQHGPSTPERYHRFTTMPTQTPSNTPPSIQLRTPSSSDTLNEADSGRCDACGRDQHQGRKMRMMPCAVSYYSPMHARKLKG